VEDALKAAEAGKNCSVEKITRSQDAEKAFREFMSREIPVREVFAIMFLSRSNKVIGLILHSSGGISNTVVDMRLVFPIGQMLGACSMIMAHNHPSGNLEPSQMDISLTEKTKEQAKLLDCNLLDHLILTEERYFSFADDGRLS